MSEWLEDIKKELELDWSDISYVVNQVDVKWLINRVEELEKVIGDLDENVAAFETLWLEEKRKNQRYKQALEEIARGRFSGASYKARQALEVEDD